MNNKIQVALPKGRLAEETLELFIKKGICRNDVVDLNSRKLIFTDEENGWEVYTQDGLPSAQWEIQVLVTNDGYEVLCW